MSANFHTTIDTSKNSGWFALLDLEISEKNGKSVVSRSGQKGPLTIQNPFYPEGDICHLYLLHPPAGIVGGDALQLNVSTIEKGSVLLTTPGATKFYRSNGKIARQLQSFTIDNNCSLEWLPQETIYFPDSFAELRTLVNLSGNGRFIGWDIHCLGLPANNEDLGKGEVNISLTIQRDDKPLLIEALHISPQKAAYQAAFLRNQQVLGTFIATSCNKVILENLREDIYVDSNNNFSATCIDDLLVVRYLGPSTIEAKKLFLKAWQTVRPHVLQRKSRQPRIWAT